MCRVCERQREREDAGARGRAGTTDTTTAATFPSISPLGRRQPARLRHATHAHEAVHGLGDGEGGLEAAHLGGREGVGVVGFRRKRNRTLRRSGARLALPFLPLPTHPSPQTTPHPHPHTTMASKQSERLSGADSPQSAREGRGGETKKRVAPFSSTTVRGRRRNQNQNQPALPASHNPPHPHAPLSLSLTHTAKLPPHLAHLPKSCAPAVAAEYEYLVAATLGDCHQPLLCSQAHGKAFKNVEAKLSKICHTTIVAGCSFDAISVWADSSSVSMGGLSTYFRVQGAAARADAAKVADFINCTGGHVQKCDENYTPPTYNWSCTQHSDLVHVLAASLAMTKVALDAFDEAYKMCCDASFAAGAAFCSAAALAQMEVARSKASLLASAKACVGDLAGQKEMDR